MRYIQADGTPAAKPRPASHPRTVLRVTDIAAGQVWRKNGEDIERLYGVAGSRWNMSADALDRTDRKKAQGFARIAV
jgi:hypothetical protein